MTLRIYQSLPSINDCRNCMFKTVPADCKLKDFASKFGVPELSCIGIFRADGNDSIIVEIEKDNTICIDTAELLYRFGEHYGYPPAVLTRTVVYLTAQSLRRKQGHDQQ